MKYRELLDACKAALSALDNLMGDSDDSEEMRACQMCAKAVLNHEEILAGQIFALRHTSNRITDYLSSGPEMKVRDLLIECRAVIDKQLALEKEFSNSPTDAMLGK